MVVTGSELGTTTFEMSSPSSISERLIIAPSFSRVSAVASAFLVALAVPALNARSEPARSISDSCRARARDRYAESGPRQIGRAVV